jgi:hypothetical protein
MMSTALLLAPLLVLAAVGLLGFVGCTDDFDALGGGESTGTIVFPGPQTPYSQIVIADGPIAYWRLVDLTDAGAPVPDEIPPGPNGKHPGWFNFMAPLATDTSLNLSDPSGTTSVLFKGGYVAAEGSDLATPTFTIEALVSARWSPKDPGAVRVVANSFDGSSGWSLFATADNTWQGQVWDAGSHFETPAVPIQLDGSTDYLALVFDPDNGLQLYVDDQSTSPALELSYQLNSSEPLCIGADGGGDGAPAVNPFEGIIQDVALYDHVLTFPQVQAHIAANTPPSNV